MKRDKLGAYRVCRRRRRRLIIALYYALLAETTIPLMDETGAYLLKEY